MEFITNQRNLRNMQSQQIATIGNLRMQNNPFMQGNPQPVQVGFVHGVMMEPNPFVPVPQQNLNAFMAGGQANGGIREYNQVATNPNVVKKAGKASAIINKPVDKMNIFLKKETMDSLKAQQANKHRIDYNWVNKEDVIDELKCEMCERYFFNPMKISCGCTFCSTCVKQLKDDGNCCPVCNVAINHNLTGKDMMVVWCLEEMDVYCPNKVEKSCAWKGPIKDLDAH